MFPKQDYTSIDQNFTIGTKYRILFSKNKLRRDILRFLYEASVRIDLLRSNVKNQENIKENNYTLEFLYIGVVRRRPHIQLFRKTGYLRFTTGC